MFKIKLYQCCGLFFLITIIGINALENIDPETGMKKNSIDKTIDGYLTERTCLWNEICKEEFQRLFRCRCPAWSFCRAPGRYYNAFCSLANTGYIWSQPGLKQQPVGPP